MIIIMEKKVKIVVAEENAEQRARLSKELNLHDGWNVVAETGDGEEAVRSGDCREDPDDHQHRYHRLLSHPARMVHPDDHHVQQQAEDRRADLYRLQGVRAAVCEHHRRHFDALRQ